MKSIFDVMAELDFTMFGGVKSPHSLSHPVLRTEDGKVYIAAFGWSYTKANLDSGLHPRPTKWALADMEGEIVASYECSERDFSSVPSERECSAVCDYDRSKIDEAYKLLEEVREAYIGGADISDSAKSYLELILDCSPEDYKQLYSELAGL